MGIGIIDRGTEGDSRMFIPPGVKGEAPGRPAVLGALDMVGEALGMGNAEPAADDCPDA